MSSSNAISVRNLKGVPVCKDKNYLIKNYFYSDSENGDQKKLWHRYYDQLDESKGVVDISMSLMREIEAPEKFQFVYFSEGKRKVILNKIFNLRREDREFYLENFEFSKALPNPQKTPGSLNIVLLKEDKPICRVEQEFISFSYN